jgi:hypothetical protein
LAPVSARSGLFRPLFDVASHRQRDEEAAMTIISSTRATTPQASKLQLWIGRGFTALFVLFMVGDSAIKLLKLDVVSDALRELGYAPELGLPIGILQAVLLVLYLVTRTSVLGAVLLTGLFGGAFAAHLRLNSPFFTHDHVRSLSRRSGLGRSVAARRTAPRAVPIAPLRIEIMPRQ